MRTRRLAVIGVVIGVGLPAVASQARAQTPSPEAVRIWESVIAANGGHERLQAIRSFVISRRTTLKVDRAVAELRVVVPGEGMWIWRESQAGKGPRRVETRVVRAADMPDHAIEIAELEAVAFLETSEFRPQVLGLEPGSAARSSVIVRVSTPLLPLIRYTVHLPSRTVMAVEITRPATSIGAALGTTEVVTYQLDGRKRVDDVGVPIVMIGQSAAYGLDFLINPDVDPRLFDITPPQNAKAASWIRFLRSGAEAAREVTPTLDPEPRFRPFWMVSGEFSNGIRGSAGATAILFGHPINVWFPFSGLAASARVGAGGATLAAGWGSLGFIGAEALATVTRTWSDTPSWTPNSTYVGGEAAVSLIFVRTSVGVATRVTGPPAPHKTVVTWSVGASVPWGFWNW